MPWIAPSEKDTATATIGFEAKWPVRKDLTADKLRNNMDAAVTERSDKRRQQPEPSKRVVPNGMFVQSELPSEATVCQFVESHGGTFRCGLSFN
ncbi:MAG: hypothetical protein EXS32_13545 [Opitutus sp.]|nr:hypothetical protein [Opitutus sp.]